MNRRTLEALRSMGESEKSAKRQKLAFDNADVVVRNWPFKPASASFVAQYKRNADKTREHYRRDWLALLDVAEKFVCCKGRHDEIFDRVTKDINWPCERKLDNVRKMAKRFFTCMMLLKQMRFQFVADSTRELLFSDLTQSVTMPLPSASFFIGSSDKFLCKMQNYVTKCVSGDGKMALRAFYPVL